MENRSYEERHQSALEVFDAFMAGTVADPERGARSFQRQHGALGSFAFDVVMGDVWARPQLSRRDRSLIVISVLATIGSTEELSLHTQVGLNNGLSRSEIEEAIIQVAAYAGFPMAMQASRVVTDRFCQIDGVDRLPERQGAEQLDDSERRIRAHDVRKSLTGGRCADDVEVDFSAMVEHLGDVGVIAYHWAFGDLWAREELTRRDRSVVVIAILAALSRVEELAFHVPAGLNHGLSRTEIEEIMVQMTIYGGIPRAVEGIQAAKKAFRKIDART
ncbi:MAG TPA: carboxymuconolactone decarboxylase family protein [Acidimicrobiales bacterium]|jgi:4-carboxymuconolactone decarboxylase|nr:carboxymuconolactone decarboxylase family protein [Acidimicrobiales bacterium]